MEIFKLALQLILIICLISCNNNEGTQNQSKEWANTEWMNLDEENIKLRIPKYLKKSSRYRIKEDLPSLAKDSTKLRLIQDALELLEFEDSPIDVLVDTSKSYRMIIICNTQRLDFNKTEALILKQQLTENNKSNEKSNPTLDYGKIKAKMKSNATHKLARYTTQIRNIIDNTRIYNSVYYLTGESYSLVVYEFSEDNESIEKYLWTTKIG